MLLTSAAGKVDEDVRASMYWWEETYEQYIDDIFTVEHYEMLLGDYVSVFRGLIDDEASDDIDADGI